MTTVSESKPPIAFFEDILCGPNVARSSTISLRSGPIELLFERETAWVRQIRTGKREMVRAIYGAVRDRDWRTVLPVLKDLSVQQHTGGGFTIRFTGECRQEEVHFVWHGRITGD